MTAGEKGVEGNGPVAETADPEAKIQANTEHNEPEEGETAESEDLRDQQIATLEAELASARQSLEESTSRLKKVSKAYSEIQSEIKAVKERMEQRAKLDSELQAFDQVRAFFDPVMNLKRALAVQGDADVLRQGIDMVHHQFLEALHKLGLAEVPGEGAPFDPNVHEALGVQPVTDPALDGRVLMVHTTGFTVKGRLLQAAQVVIGKYEAESEA